MLYEVITDLQHQKLIGLINQLYEAMREGKGKNVITSYSIHYTKLYEFAHSLWQMNIRKPM